MLARRCGGSVAARGARAAGRAECSASEYLPWAWSLTIRKVQARLARFQQAFTAIGLDRRAATCGIDVRWGWRGIPTRWQIRGGTCLAVGTQTSFPGHGQFLHGGVVAAPFRCRSCSCNVPDPVGAGFVDSLARPGGNVTGFMGFEYGMSGNGLSCSKKVAPGVTRVAVLRDPALPAGIGQLAAIQAVAPSLRIEVSAVNVPRHVARSSIPSRRSHAHANSGLIVTQSALATIHRELIVTLAARHRLPAVYTSRIFVTARRPSVLWGICDQDRLGGRLCRSHPQGCEASRLPVQAPTKFELAINMKTAKVLGLAVPPTLLATADEVIE